MSLVRFLLVSLLAVMATQSHAQQAARERERAAGATEAARTKELANAGLPPEIASCQAKLERSLTRNRKWEAFRWVEQASDVKREKPKGKFSPRFPVDVQEVAKFPGELRAKRKTPDEEEKWAPAEAWCGLVNGKVSAVDVFGPGEKIVP